MLATLEVMEETRMPLVRISVKEGRTPNQQKVIADAVYHAMREALNVPENDRFQVVTEYAGDGLIYDPHYLGIERTDGIVFIHIFLRKGRTVEVKQAFYKRTAELLQEWANVRPEDVLIALTENDAADWSFGNGVAQYVP